jgi:hypothetical protein
MNTYIVAWSTFPYDSKGTHTDTFHAFNTPEEAGEKYQQVAALPLTYSASISLVLESTDY